MASTAMHQDSRDQRNILEDIADRLCALSAATTPPQAEQAGTGEAVGVTVLMPGTPCFTTACFHHEKVPAGTRLYTHPAPQPDDAMDAKRYRWLRNRADDWYVGPRYETYNDVVVSGSYNDLSGGGVALDSAIDAALSAHEQKGGAA